MNALNQSLDPMTARAVGAFMARVAREFPMVGAILFGSRARQTHRVESDADVAVLLRGTPGHRVEEALKMADIAFDVMMETGVLIEAVPLWEIEWEHPETFNNPAFIENIRREGVPL